MPHKLGLAKSGADHKQAVAIAQAASQSKFKKIKGYLKKKDK